MPPAVLTRTAVCRPRRHPRPARVRSILFRCGDALFLTGIGGVTTWSMQMMHECGWSFIVCMGLGMALAMVVQTLLAWCVAPILGSIESMVPSMVLAMISPMSICSARLLGFEPDGLSALGLGMVFGLLMFGFIETYGAACRRLLARAFPES